MFHGVTRTQSTLLAEKGSTQSKPRNAYEKNIGDKRLDSIY